MTKVTKSVPKVGGAAWVGPAMAMRIDEPCEESWDAMAERGDGRFCERCQHRVIDLSRMSRAQAEARIARTRGPYVCVRMAADAEGTPVFRSEPSRVRHAAGGLVLVAALTAGGCASRDDAEPAIVEVMEPCAVDGPPMLPIDDATPIAADPVITGPVSVEPEVQDGGPTAEQRALTAAKHRPPIVHHVMGRMPMRSY